jgi:hypothetical protein
MLSFCKTLSCSHTICVRRHIETIGFQWPDGIRQALLSAAEATPAYLEGLKYIRNEHLSTPKIYPQRNLEGLKYIRNEHLHHTNSKNMITWA